jgi:hypothetical protein
MKKLNYPKLTDIERNKYNVMFGKIYTILNRNNLDAQANVMLELIDQLKHNHYDQFMETINGVSLWGGSGAVWEVYIEDKNDAKSFELEIIDLINLMEDTKILGRGIKPIRKIFKKLNKM